MPQKIKLETEEAEALKMLTTQALSVIKWDNERLVSFIEKMAKKFEESSLSNDEIKQRIFVMKPALKALGIEFVIRPTIAGRTIYVRASPYVRNNPTFGLIDSRVKFGEISKKAIGMSFSDTENKPPAMKKVESEMTGWSSRHKLLKVPKWQRKIEQRPLPRR